MTPAFDEEALRALVRDAIGRLETPLLRDGETRPLKPHASHYRYALQPSEGPCVIEPEVRCNHCGYCESHGH